MNRIFLTPLAGLTLWSAAQPNVQAQSAAVVYEKSVLPILNEFCNNCHSTEKHKGDLDLQRFRSFAEIRKEPEIWEHARDQMADGEMPPKDKPQPSPEQKATVMNWIAQALEEIGRENAGDPGPVVLRRLSNAEYTYTLRDLTGVPSLDPAHEFPVDGAAGEGFTNAGAALVMSPGLLTKYMDAAKEVVSHAVLLPDGIAFSDKTTRRDWTEEKLAAIRQFYAQYTEDSGGTAVNIQGIQLETNGGGRLPLERYLRATIEEREALRSDPAAVDRVAQSRGLNAKYLRILWEALSDTKPNIILDPVRREWAQARPDDTLAVTAAVARWQKALWRFTTVGHIGKRDGPPAWQVPVDPVAAKQEVRLKLPPAQDGYSVVYLSASDAGDGNAHDFALWENVRLTAPGRPDLLLRDVRRASAVLTESRRLALTSAERCLTAASEVQGPLDAAGVEALSARHGISPVVLAAWLNYLGIGAGEAAVTGYMTQKLESASNYDFIKAWAGADALSVVANSSAQAVRIPGNMKPHSVAMHPSPSLKVAAGWRSPLADKVRVTAKIQHAHPECGNGVAWSLELRRGHTRRVLDAGFTEGAKEIAPAPIEGLAVTPGDLISLILSPKDSNHSCDLTAVDLIITGSMPDAAWDLAADVSPDLLSGNPHADRHGRSNIWHFYSEPDKGGEPARAIPAGSLLARWQEAPPQDKAAAAAAVQQLLQGAAPAGDSPDAVLYRQLTAGNGPLLAEVRRRLLAESTRDAAEGDGPDPALFGRHPDGTALDAASLCVQAPHVLEVRIPAELAEGCELVATAGLHPSAAAEGSVQMQILTAAPAGSGLAAGAGSETGRKGTWSDGQLPLQFESPVLTAEGSAARQRVLADMEAFRALFPAALCYTRIVPVDEVVTLTLFYREDHHLKRLMLDDAAAAALDRLWEEMHFISQDALTLVDAFEQLWQFATQDADPSAFEPMRAPIMQRAAAFRQQLQAAEPAHVKAVLDFAPLAWRRPLEPAETAALQALYQKLRAQELPHEEAVRMLLVRVLTAPAFLYKGEKAPSGAASAPVKAHELAVRLSYFLWASAPDAALRAAADSGRLTDPAELKAQVTRMMRDARIRRLATEFGCQWLHVRDIDTLDEKSERHFPTFTAVRSAMKEEAVLFFTDLFQQNRPVLSLLNADYTFVNAELAAHYVFAAVEPGTWQRVDQVQSKGRGGVLGFAATLARQSGASRTSPILRGNWFCETLLGERLPRPPKGVPTLPEEAPAGLTERQLIEKHSSDPNCAGCHARIDPFGYALEGFDAIGRFRTQDAAGLPVNTAVTLPNGTAFDGLDGLRHYLMGPRREQFLRQFCRKLLGYALGRSVLLSDKPLIDDMIRQLDGGNAGPAVLLELIVTSRQFREIRGQTP